MIKDPWPCYYKPYGKQFEEGILTTNRKHQYPACRYQKRYNLMCYARPKMFVCTECYMWQQNSDGADVVHVCDRCGYETTGGDDRLTYLTVQNRQGGYLVSDVELCGACANQLAKWLGGKDFFEDFYEE